MSALIEAYRRMAEIELKDMQMITNALPFKITAKVRKGYGDNGRLTGYPTANLDVDPVRVLPFPFMLGIYCGWGQVDNGPVHKLVMTVGYNVFHFDRDVVTLEAHFLNQKRESFIGSNIKVILTGWVRDQKAKTNLEKYQKELCEDSRYASDYLDLPEQQAFKADTYFKA